MKMFLFVFRNKPLQSSIESFYVLNFDFKIEFPASVSHSKSIPFKVKALKKKMRRL